MQLCNFAHNGLSQKTMFKVSNRNSCKRCLLISKITLKTSKQRHLTTSYLPKVTVQNHVWTVFFRIYTNVQSKLCFQFCFQVRRPVISTIVNPYMSFYEKHYRNIWVVKIQNIIIFLFLKKHFSFYLIFTMLDILIFCNIL